MQQHKMPSTTRKGALVCTAAGQRVEQEQQKMPSTTRKGALVCTAAGQRVEQEQHRHAVTQNA
jgi:hypothetical protein